MNQLKPVVWLHGEVTTPPFSEAALIEARALLDRVRRGEKLEMPHSRPMSQAIGARCHELRIRDAEGIHRIVYRIDANAVVIVEVFVKKTQQTPAQIIKNCKRRLRLYDGEKGR